MPITPNSTRTMNMTIITSQTLLPIVATSLLIVYDSLLADSRFLNAEVLVLRLKPFTGQAQDKK
jgi:hypothetical protein